MKRKVLNLSLLGSVVPVLAAALITGPAVIAQTPATAQSQAQVDARVDALMKQMTVEEKAGQISQVFALPGMEGALGKQIAGGQLGSVLFLSKAADTNRFQRMAVEQSRLKIPLLFGFDVIHGLHTIFPVPIGMAASWDPVIVEQAQAAAAREARAVGIHWTFAPMVDIARDPRWGRMVEGAGEDPYLGSAMAAAQVRGFQNGALGQPDRVLAGPKHFVGYGAALGGRDYDEVDVSDAQLWNVYLPPFKAAIDAGAENVMAAYMQVNGIPAPGSRWLLNDVLRDKLGFKGFVVNDADGVRNLIAEGFATGPDDAAVRAINAGVGMEMALASPAFRTLPKAIAAGKVDPVRLDEAARRILSVKMRLGLFDKPYVDEAKAERVFADPKTRVLARRAAERAAVLLRNEGGLLPLDAKKLRSMAVVGPLADSATDALGPWVFKENNPPSSSILAGLRNRLKGVRISYTQGVPRAVRAVASPFAGLAKAPTDLTDSKVGIPEAVAAANAADVTIMVLGENQDMIGESASRASLALPGEQQALLDAVVATGKPVVIVLLNGRPLDLGGTKAQAILDAWYPGSEAGAAVANLLLGDVAPGGKLPFTWPANVGHVPLIYSHLNSHQPNNATKRYWDQPGPVAWPYGYGLSYTSFAYSNLKVDRETVAPGQPIEVSVDLRNTGARAADEVAQLYIHQRSGTASRPVRELKGFQRVTLKPGETRRLSFQLRPEDLRYWNSATHDWVADEAVFDVAVGGDSRVPFRTTFNVAADR
ncbi:MAG TPA: beta-glucosidase BglX [Sphingobium sp.]